MLTALTYILNRGLNDYMGPAAHLLMALLRPSAHGPGSDSKAAGYRLLVYLRCCLTGCSFPPGAQTIIIVLFPPQRLLPDHFTAQHSQPGLLRQLLYMLAVWCCREDVLMVGRSCLGMQSTMHDNLTCAAATLQADQSDAWQRQ